MKRFGIEQEDYPVFKLFIKGKDVMTFSGDVTENRLLTFTQENTGFWFGKCHTWKTKFMLKSIFNGFLCTLERRYMVPDLSGLISWALFKLEI